MDQGTSELSGVHWPDLNVWITVQAVDNQMMHIVRRLHHSTFVVSPLCISSCAKSQLSMTGRLRQ